MKKNKKYLFLVITVAMAIGLVMTSATSLSISKSREGKNELKVTMSNHAAQKLAIPSVRLDKPLQTILNPFSDPAFDFIGDQVHPAFARSGNIHMAAYRDVDLGEIMWTYSDDDGLSYDSGIYWDNKSGDYPSIKHWDGERFFGTFVTDPLDGNGGRIYLYEFNNVTDLANDTLNPLYAFDWFQSGWSDMIDADIACDNSQNNWEFGLSVYVMSTTYGSGYTDGPTFVYSDENSQGLYWLDWNNYNNCSHCDVDIDNSTIFSYAVFDWKDTTAGYYKILCKVYDFAEIVNGYEKMYELDYGSNTQTPAVAAGDGNIVILAETDVNGNKDIICFYGTNLSLMSSSFVVDTNDNESFPDVRHISGERFIATYVKNGNLYAAVTNDAGATWAESRWQINDNDYCVVEEYKTSDLCELANKVMWEEDCGDDIDIYISKAEQDPNNPPSAPDIDGPTNGKPKTSYPYTFTSVDPEDDDVSYYIRWGDGDITNWTDFQSSGAPGYTESHSWNTQGTFIIQAKAKDINGQESDWKIFTVTMPRNKAINNLFLQFLQNHPNLFPILRQLFGL